MLNISEHIIIRSLQKTASMEEEKRLNDWLREDREHVARFVGLKEIWNARRRMTDEEVSRCWDELCRRIGDGRQEDTPAVLPGRRKRLAPVRMRYAAAALAGILISSAVWLGVKPSRETRILVNNVIYNHNGVQKVELPDRSVVWLNENSRLSYPDHFEGDMRAVSFDGKAFFEIAKDSSRPFTVQSGDIRIEVAGTSFFVRSDMENHTVVTLVTGEVNIRRTDESGNMASFTRLAPGQQADFNRQTDEIAVNTINTAFYTAWKDGSYRFTNETLENIVRQLEYRFRIEIQLSPKLADRRFTGRILPEHHIRDVLEILRESHPVTCRIMGTTVYIHE
jgi:ferric-dicitrate binding protein FerR (iron transport regulator)